MKKINIITRRMEMRIARDRIVMNPDNTRIENLRQYCRERLIPFQVDALGRPAMKYGGRWYRVECLHDDGYIPNVNYLYFAAEITPVS